jgi:hypothetical protein
MLYPSYTGSEEDAVEKFDSEFGGIRGAISAGILPGALQTVLSSRLLEKYPKKEKKEFAGLSIPTPEQGVTGDQVLIYIAHGEERRIGPLRLVGALNWLRFHGYTYHESHCDVKNRYEDQLAFSRTIDVASNNSSSACFQIFIESDSDSEPRDPVPNSKTALAFYILNKEDGGPPLYFTPRALEAGGDEDDLNARWATLVDRHTFLKEGYINREVELEKQFRSYMDHFLKEIWPEPRKEMLLFRIFSRTCN